MVSRLLPVLQRLVPSQRKKVVVGGFDPSEAYLAALEIRKRITRLAFLGCVVVPVVLSTIFYGLLAAPRYSSETQFIVRSVSSQRASGLEMLFRTFGLSRTVDDAYAVQKYLQSRDVLRALQDRGHSIENVFGEKGDFFSRYPRFWRQNSAEARFDYFLDRVSIAEDTVKGITILKVVSFDRNSSRNLAKEMLSLAEEMVNKMNARAQRDIIDVANSEVRLAEARTIEAQASLALFRNRELLIDPSKSSLGVLETIASLSADISYASAQLRELRLTSPASPAIPSIAAKISTLEERVRIERAKLTGGTDSLSEKMASYEQLSLQRELAEKSLASAMKSLDLARQEARRQHIYIEEVVSPHLPDESTEPKRLRGIFTIFVFGFAMFSIIWILSVGAGEHAQ
ncbi:MAG: capsular polysaccharide transport system permease [Beijerinckiaceae bacterium]|nr:MAG: capsular polysaccharide transport system permease [Beijerinckiaceae bacterium]